MGWLSVWVAFAWQGGGRLTRKSRLRGGRRAVEWLVRFWGNRPFWTCGSCAVVDAALEVYPKCLQSEA